MDNLTIDLGLTDAEREALRQMKKRRSRRRGNVGPWCLTEHQARIMDALVKDSRAKAIARALDVPDVTIRSHVFRITHRMGTATMVRSAVLWDRWRRFEASQEGAQCQ